MTQTGGVADRLSEWISLGVLASWVPRDAVDEAIEVTGKGARRKGGKLPPHVMVYFAMALALFAEEDYEEVIVGLTQTLASAGGRMTRVISVSVTGAGSGGDGGIPTRAERFVTVAALSSPAAGGSPGMASW